MDNFTFERSWLHWYTISNTANAHERLLSASSRIMFRKIKADRLTEIIAVQKVEARKRTERLVGGVYRVLVEGPSKKNPEEFYGRTTHNSVVIFPKGETKTGDYINVKINDCTAVTLFGEITKEEATA